MKGNAKFYLPWYWPIWGLFFIVWLLIKLPYRWQVAMGGVLGLIMMRFSGKSKHIAEVNLQLCFPEKTIKERKALLSQSFKNIGIAVFETALGFWGNSSRLDRWVFVSGYEENIAPLLKKGRGVLMLGAHFTTLELVGRVFGQRYPFSVMYRPHKIPILNFFIERALRKHYRKAIPRYALREMIGLLKKPNIIWYSADVNAGRKASVFAPFFGVEAATVKAVSRFVELTGCAVVPAFHYRRPDSSGYDVVFYPELKDFPSGDYVQDATRVNQCIESFVRRCPEQYLWQYMRFKTRPLGEARVY